MPTQKPKPSEQIYKNADELFRNTDLNFDSCLLEAILAYLDETAEVTYKVI